MTAPLVIAIDGLAASGKGTVARQLAAHFGFAHLDTGLLYRAVGLAVLRQGGDPADAASAAQAAAGLDPRTVMALADDPALRADTTSVAASQVAAIPAVRAELLQFQQDFCRQPPGGKRGAVLDGRDIGTVIAPDAAVKLYITADVETRAQRRFKELQAKGGTDTYDAILTDMQARDTRDQLRSIAPAKPAPDAVTIDTSELTAAQALAQALAIVQGKLP